MPWTDIFNKLRSPTGAKLLDASLVEEGADAVFMRMLERERLTGIGSTPYSKIGFTEAWTGISAIAVSATQIDTGLAYLTRTQRQGGGYDLAVASNGASRIYTVWNGLQRSGGFDSYEATFLVTTANTGAVELGLSIGDAGATRRHILYRSSDGLILIRKDDESQDTALLATKKGQAASRTFGTGATIKVRLDLYSDGRGYVYVTRADGKMQPAVRVDGLPLGRVGIAMRGQAAVTAQSLVVSGGSASAQGAAQTNASFAAKASKGGQTLAFTSMEGLTIVPWETTTDVLTNVAAEIVASGLQITSTANSTNLAVETPFQNDEGEVRFDATITVSSLTSTGQWLGLFSGDGVTRKEYFLIADGRLFIRTNDGTATGSQVQMTPYTGVPSSASTITAGMVIKLKLVTRPDNTGYFEVVMPSGFTARYPVTGIPRGSLGVITRGQLVAVVNSVHLEGVNSRSADKLTDLEARLAALEAPVQRANDAVSRLTAAAGLTPYVFPSAFPWRPDFPIYRDDANRCFPVGYDHQARRPFTEVQATAVLYVDPVAGTDASNRGSAAAPLKSLKYALDGRAGNVLIRAKGGLYDRTTSFAQANVICDNLIVESWDGAPVVSSMHYAGLAWTSVGSGAYQATLPAGATINRIADLADPDSDGYGKPIVAKADVAAVQAATAGYVLSGTTLTLKRISGVAPDASVRVFEDFGNFRRWIGGGTLWFDKISFEGGRDPFTWDYLGDYPNSPLVNVYTRGKLFMRDGRFAYSGTSGWGVGNAITLRGPVDAIFHRYITAQAHLDGLNWHGYAFGDPSQAAPRVVEIDCGGRGNADSTGGSNNSSTAHDGTWIIRINTGLVAGLKYYGSEQRVIYDVNGCYSLNLGLSVGQSRSSGEPGSSIATGHPTQTPEGGRMWCDNCTILPGSAYAYQTYQDAIIYEHGTVYNGASNWAGSNIVSY